MGRSLGFATVSILHAIGNGRRYGLEIMDETGLGGGTIYKVLHRLEERRFVAGKWESAEVAERERRPRRRYYQLTAAGRSALSEALEQYGALAGRGRSIARERRPLPREG